jgi:3-hydroxyisobutyrate dehydrogenase-like beta-hydroxyacid dehydrogenase
MIDGGFSVILWARREASLEQYRGKAAGFANTITELGAGADHVGICVVTDDDVREVCGQLLPAMRSGSVLAIHSTVHPQTVQDLEVAAAKFGVRVVDAPVSGGTASAAAGLLTVMVGGEAAPVAAALPVFETFGQLIVHLGPVGTGQEAKLINNTLLAANLGIAEDALAVGEKLGIARETLIQILSASSGNSFALGVSARMKGPGSFAHGGKLLDKDMRILGEVMGKDCPAFGSLHGAAKPFLNRVLASPPEIGG